MAPGLKATNAGETGWHSGSMSRFTFVDLPNELPVQVGWGGRSLKSRRLRCEHEKESPRLPAPESAMEAIVSPPLTSRRPGLPRTG